MILLFRGQFFFSSAKTAEEVIYCTCCTCSHNSEQNWPRKSQVQGKGPKGPSWYEQGGSLKGGGGNGCSGSTETSSRQSACSPTVGTSIPGLWLSLFLLLWLPRGHKLAVSWDLCLIFLFLHFGLCIHFFLHLALIGGEVSQNVELRPWARGDFFLTWVTHFKFYNEDKEKNRDWCIHFLNIIFKFPGNLYSVDY